MKMAIEINLKNGMPTVDEAMQQLKEAIKRYGKNQCLILLHGYGSSGKGGIIRQKVRQWLNAQVRNGKIQHCVNGEDFSIFNDEARALSTKYNGLENLKNAGNHGMTIIEI